MIDGSPDVIWHGIHVDDVASGYFAIATKILPAEAHGQVFTMSNDTYETFQQLADGVAKANKGQPIVYQKYEGEKRYRDLSAFSQALKSERIRALGWKPVKPTFLQGLDMYKASFDEALERRDPAVVRLIGLYLGDDAIKPR